MIVEIIQPDLAPGNDLWPLCQFPHLLEIGIACKLGLVRMNSNGRVNEVVLFGELDPAVERPGAGSAADRDNRFDSGFAGASDHLFTVGIKLLHLEMCMGIDEDGSLVVGHWLCSDGRLARQVGCRGQEAGFISVSFPQAHLRGNPPAQPCRPPATRPQSFRSIPVPEAFWAQGSPRLPLSSRSTIPVRTIRRFQPQPAEPLYPSRLRGGATCPHL